MCSLSSELASNAPKCIDDGEVNLDFESIVTADEAATHGISGKLREVQRV